MLTHLKFNIILFDTEIISWRFVQHEHEDRRRDIPNVYTCLYEIVKACFFLQKVLHAGFDDRKIESLACFEQRLEFVYTVAMADVHSAAVL